MEQSILCGVDGSEESTRALSTARWLADAIPARLAVIHVASEPPDHPARGDGSYLIARDAAEERGNIVLAQALDRAGLPRQLTRRVELGDPAERLAAAAGEEDAALVVVGTRGRGALRSAFLGSVSQDLVDACKRPLVVVPPGASVSGEGDAVRALVCGFDGSESSERAVAAGGWLAGALDLELVIANARPAAGSQASIPGSSGFSPVDAKSLEERSRRQGVELLDRAERVVRGAVPVRRRLAFGDPAAALTELAATEEAAMVVVGSRARGAVKAAVLGSVSSAVIERARTPVVLVTAEARVPQSRPQPRTASEPRGSASRAQR